MHLIKVICRILTLMARLLILIIALNAFITPVFAKGVCEMMDVTTIEISSNTMSKMDCSACDDTACSTTQCGIGSSTATTPALFSEKKLLLIVTGHHQSQASFAYFYTITLPVNTPPLSFKKPVYYYNDA